MARSNLPPDDLVLENAQTVDFIETIDYKSASMDQWDTYLLKCLRSHDQNKYDKTH